MSSIVDATIGRLLERAVRQARADSPRAVSLLKSLSGRRLAVRIVGTPWDLVVESTGDTLLLAGAPTPAGAATVSPAATASASAPATIDATIAGGPLALLTLAGPDPQAVIGRGDVTISGDAEIAQQFRELGTLLRPDLEAGLSRVVGRSAAHVAMRGLHAVADRARERARTLTLDAADYLAHERRTLVSGAEAEHFLRGVDAMRERLDRLEARANMAEQRMRKT